MRLGHRHRVRFALCTALGASFAWIVIGSGFVNYDTLFNLTWGSEVTRGSNPQPDLALAPTPKPLVIVAGALLSPLGHASQTVVVIGALLALGALAVAAARLASQVAGPVAAALTAALVLTREPILSFGVRAYADVPYTALVVVALTAAVRGSRPARVLFPLALAGLLRPEAWIFSLTYLLFAARRATGRQRLALTVLALAAPALWCVADLLLTGNPVFSLVGTRANAAVLDRETGLGSAFELTPRRLGEIVREPVVVAGVVGAAFLAHDGRRGGRAVLVALALALGAFALLAAAGLPVLGRYLVLEAVLLVVIAAAGIEHAIVRARAGDFRWAIAAAGACALLVVFTPAQVTRLDRLRSTIASQRTIASDLHALADAGSLRRCGRVRAPNHRVRPMLAAWLEVPAQSIAAGGPPQGTSLVPATRRVERLFILDPRDRVRGRTTPPPGAARIATNGSWQVFTRCAGATG